MLGEREVAMRMASDGEVFFVIFMVNGWGWLLVFAGTECRMREIMEIDCRI